MSDLLFQIASAILIAVAGVTPVAKAQAYGERITDFTSYIDIRPDSTIKVREEISVYVTGDSIKHGIYRDIPTKYKDRLGNNYTVDLNVSDIKKDGYPELYSVSNENNDERIKIGNPNAIVLPGSHTYSITYEATRELGFFKDYDELYWNVTGNKWLFPIDKASAVIRLPNGIGKEKIKTLAWTGRSGSIEANYTSAVTDDEIIFETTKPLATGEGLTIAVSWPKGFVTPPSADNNVRHFLKDNPKWIDSLIAITIIASYYLLFWFLVGRDPEREAIVAEYEPPEKLSPAEMRYLTSMKSDNIAFASAIINMGVKGYLKISDTPDAYSARKTGADTSLLSAEEAAMAGKLFGKKKSEINFDPKNYDTIESAKAALGKALGKRFGNAYFILNSPYAAAGILISALASIASFKNFSFGDFMALGTSAFATAIVVVSYKIVHQIKSMKSGPAKVVTVIISLFVVLSVLPAVLTVLSVSGYSFNLHFLYLPAVFGINAVFLHLLKRRTPAGQKIQDKITGFKRYLSLAEKDRMNFHNPPEMTPELFEKFLPYALALEVEHKWAEIFSATVNSVTPEQEYRRPSWYLSGKTFSGYSGMALGMSSLGGGLASAIYTSSLIRPGSSSAFGGSSGGFGGGGGFSGGGGGGGGGGGW